MCCTTVEQHVHVLLMIYIKCSHKRVAAIAFLTAGMSSAVSHFLFEKLTVAIAPFKKQLLGGPAHTIASCK
jgi:hypothetical protein